MHQHIMFRQNCGPTRIGADHPEEWGRAEASPGEKGRDRRVGRTAPGNTVQGV